MNPHVIYLINPAQATATGLLLLWVFLMWLLFREHKQLSAMEMYLSDQEAEMNFFKPVDVEDFEKHYTEAQRKTQLN